MSEAKEDMTPKEMCEAGLCVSMSQARRLLSQTRVCRQCQRRLPSSYFSATEEAKKANPGIEMFCALCWSCP